MAYKVIILYRLYMPSYFLGTFTEYPYVEITYYNKSPGKHDKSYGMRLFRIWKIMLPGHFLDFCLL